MDTRLSSWLAVVCVWALLPGCSAKPKAAPATPAAPVFLDKPVIDFQRGGGGLPLVGRNMPATCQDLAESLKNACALRVDLAGSQGTVLAAGANYPDLDLLRIDISSGKVREHYKPKQMKAQGPVSPGITARRFEYIADPLIYQGGETRLRITASEARLDFMREPSGQGLLVLTDAEDGALEFSAKLADLRPMMLAGARTHSRSGFWIRDVQVNLSSEQSSTIAAEVTLSSMWLVIPATFRLHARATIDSDCNVLVSELWCEGLDVGGSLAAVLIGDKLRKYDGRLMPLAKWPGDRIGLRDVQIRIDDSLSLSVQFGRKSDQRKNQLAGAAGQIVKAPDAFRP